MSCCHHYALAPGGDAVFAVDVSAITYGAGCLGEAGAMAYCGSPVTTCE